MNLEPQNLICTTRVYTLFVSHYDVLYTNVFGNIQFIRLFAAQGMLLWILRAGTHVYSIQHEDRFKTFRSM